MYVSGGLVSPVDATVYVSESVSTQTVGEWPTQDLYRIVPKTILNSLLKKKIYIDGAGNSYRSFIYIDDASAAPYIICKKGKLGRTYHISTKKLISIKSLVTKIYSKI